MKEIITPNNISKIEYIGYYKMLEKILSLIDKVSYENKIILIDKYIELTKLIKKEVENNE